MSRYEMIQKELVDSPKTWVVTGVAGFIGSNLLEKLLKLNQIVVGIDNFSTGYKRNLDEVETSVTKAQWEQFTFYEGDICDAQLCEKVVVGADYVLHEAALGSVPRSIAEPLKSNETNVTGFLNILNASKNENVKSFTYAASSSTYGDHPVLPKVEDNIGNPLSPYAVTKYVNELYAGVYARTYNFHCIGLRYFNVFGKRQDPNGSYAAVIPKWASCLVNGEPITINGDGETSRDFCHVDNVVQANLLAATASQDYKNEVYNVAVGQRTTLKQLYVILKDAIRNRGKEISSELIYADFRAGDVKHSLANIDKVKNKLSYEPKFDLYNGIENTIDWYLDES